ncbi:MAG: zf-HC2 domain-containing protein [Acidobacteriota bacterium]|nr:zf-HC2 domain-containing protein [Acidobacteriota bacterium]MDH3529728.1 zf-HC2 domain-containing protein [Acidobacteriota bacterium]
MKSKCFDIGVIQAFVDGELGVAGLEDVVRHLSVCEECNSLAVELESENELAFGALGSELNALVPTERLRTKVFASIENIETSQTVGFWSRISKGFGSAATFGRPLTSVFASVLFFVALTAVLLQYLDVTDPATDPGIAPSAVEVRDGTDETPFLSSVNDDRIEEDDMTQPGIEAVDPPSFESNRVAPVRAIAAVHRVQPRRQRTSGKEPVRGPDQAATTPVSTVLSPELDAEDGYLRTIATLNRTVDSNKDYVLRPSERVNFERQLAVVNDAIRKMKGEVRQNPNNSAAREVLRSSYKNKIELLSSVAERSETVASLD